MRRILWLALWALIAANSANTLRASVSPQQLSTAATIQAVQPASSKVWVGRYAEFEAFLKTAKIERMVDIGVGVTRPQHCFFTPGGLAAGANCKNLPPGELNGFFESYKSEIAAYKLDRLLQLDMVPPTVERLVNGNLQSVQLWLENVRTLKQVDEQKLKSPDLNKWNFELYRQIVFDDLVANIDENGGNLLFDPAWNRIKVDHSRCFTDTQVQPLPLTRIDRPFFDRIKALDPAAVGREIGDLLEPGALNALLVRRDNIVKTFEKLAKEKGESQVFVP